MAAGLPKFIALKSHLGRYASYERDRPHVYCAEEKVLNPFTKIAVEAAQGNDKYIHLRFLHTNKYWRCAGPDEMSVSAVSYQPDESLEWSSTLLRPRVLDGGQRLVLWHVKSDDLLKVHDSTDRIHVGHGGFTGVFSVVDWDSLLEMPPRVAFRGDNGKHLKTVAYNKRRFLQFSSEDRNDKYSIQSVRIRSDYFQTFWSRDSPSWVSAESTDDKDKYGLFWPVKVGDSTDRIPTRPKARTVGEGRNLFICINILIHTIALRHSFLFCRRRGKHDFLNFFGHSITREAQLVVDQLVLERSVDSVRYRMEDARIFNQKPFLAGTGSSDNLSIRVKVSYEDTRTHSFTKNASLKVGLPTAIKVGCPFIAEGKIQISAEADGTVQWGDTIQEKKLVEVQYTSSVPARSRVTVQYVGTEGTCSVPFSYTQRDKMSSTPLMAAPLH